MIAYSDPPTGLEVSRGELAHAVEVLASRLGKRATGVSLRFEDGWLYIESGNVGAKVPACGVWLVTVIVGASWVRRLARSLPAGDPVHLHCSKGRLYANRYSQPCAWTPEHCPRRPEMPEVDEKRLILEAATVLKPLLITHEDLKVLVAESRARGPASWYAKEKKMITLVSKAWELLAPLGVETADIRRLVDKSVRNAWK